MNCYDQLKLLMKEMFNQTVGSLDVASLYPSLNISTCAKVISDKLFHSELVFLNLNWNECTMMLLFQMTPEHTYLKEYQKDRNRSLSERHRPWSLISKLTDEVTARRTFCKCSTRLKGMHRFMQTHSHYIAKKYHPGH